MINVWSSRGKSISSRNILAVAVAALAIVADGREVTVLSDGWEFSLDRKIWRGVRVPHDWGVESGFDMAKYDGENGALPWKGVGWYRRTLVLDDEPKGRRMSLVFDGVLADGVCSVNGQVAGRGSIR